jgi:guanylate kinase
MKREYHSKPFLIILSSPSGGGKSTILREILSSSPDIDYSISYTTRPPRGSEQNGKAYFFVSVKEFEEKIKQGDFLEHANVFGHWYGTSKEFIKSTLAKGHHVIMDIDVQGAIQISETDFDIVKIFILPPSLSVLKQRLMDRNTDIPEVIEKRLQTAKKEIACLEHYDYLVINEDINIAVEEVKQIIHTETLRTKRYCDIEKTFFDLEVK